MLGRREFGVAGVSAIALAALQNQALAQGLGGGGQAATNDQESRADIQRKDCAKACSDCQRECDACATHCAHQLAEGHDEHLKTLATCRDCSTICAAAAEIVAAGGPFAAIICEACAEACNRCATECRKFPHDKHMQACAEECSKCEKECKDMLKYVKK